MINSNLVVSFDRIVSEYGMCELASQAWSYKALAPNESSWDRPYSFPAHIRLQTTLGKQHLHSSGKGSS